jgi:hypothetical protein
VVDSASSEENCVFDCSITCKYPLGIGFKDALDVFAGDLVIFTKLKQHLPMLVGDMLTLHFLERLYRGECLALDEFEDWCFRNYLCASDQFLRCYEAFALSGYFRDSEELRHLDKSTRIQNIAVMNIP